jgi:hypothetical protein
MIMTSAIAKTLTIAAVAVLALGIAPKAKADCSEATLKGTYSDQDTGTIVGVGPFAGVNLDNFDGNGIITSSGWSSVNGSVSYGEVTGKYKVNADCTGTYSVSGGGATYNAFFVIDDGGDELRIVITNTGTVINCVAHKQFRERRD